MTALKRIGYLVGVVAMIAYVLNPGAGVVEFLPDNLPLIGNLDEATAVGLAIHWWRRASALKPGREQKEEDKGPTGPA